MVNRTWHPSQQNRYCWIFLKVLATKTQGPWFGSLAPRKKENKTRYSDGHSCFPKTQAHQHTPLIPALGEAGSAPRLAGQSDELQ